MHTCMRDAHAHAHTRLQARTVYCQRCLIVGNNDNFQIGVNAEISVNSNLREKNSFSHRIFLQNNTLSLTGAEMLLDWGTLMFAFAVDSHTLHMSELQA